MLRSATFTPGEHLIIDSCYLNTSTEQISKMIVFVDQCTGRIAALPTKQTSVKFSFKNVSTLPVLQSTSAPGLMRPGQ